MESLTTYTSSLGIHNITLTKTDAELTIEIENSKTLQFYSTKLNDDIVTEATGKVFPKIDAVFQSFITALDKSEPSTKLTISSDSKLTFCHKTMVGKVEIPITFTISLEEVQEDPSRRHERQIANLTNKIAELESQIRTLRLLDYVRISPVFDAETQNNSAFTFTNYNKTVLRSSGTNNWAALFAKDPLPTHGKCQFTVKIEKTDNNPGNIMIGLVSGSLKTNTSCYSCEGSICMNICNNNVYYNEVVVVAINLTLAYVGDRVSILIDFDQSEIIFKIENYLIYRRKCDFSQFIDSGLYPCIHSHNLNDSVTFI